MARRIDRWTYVVISILLIGASARAQFSMNPEWNWKTVRTRHFRVHYPARYEEWTMFTVARMESIHARVVQFLGYELDETVDVIVQDPFHLPNGMAIPLLRMPRMMLFATAPPPESLFGGLSAWPELLFSHEDLHMAHLMRKGRSLRDRLSALVIPEGPLARKLPRWAVEGFAVITEGEITGHGRTRSGFRATMLRQLARYGKLPDYGQLNSYKGWLGGRFPYLIGSAFLEWLEKRSGNPECYLHLWKRLSARKHRDFKEAFSGVFGGEPQDLYDRFRAETIARAIEIEKQLNEQGLVEGEVWAQPESALGRPALSPDGSRMAVVVKKWRKPPRLEIWSVTETEEKKGKTPPPNPEDVPDVEWKPKPRKVLHRFSNPNGIRPMFPRWMPDGDSIIFNAMVPDIQGIYHFEIFRWFPETGDVERLTKEADIIFPEPFPDGKKLAGVRNRNGKSELVVFHLAAGAVTSFTEPSLTESWGMPRVSRDGTRIAAASWGKDFSRITVFDAGGAVLETYEAPGGEVAVFPVWDGGGDLFFVESHQGLFDLFRMREVPGNSGGNAQVSRTVSCAFAPEIAAGKDGKEFLYYLELTAKGMNIRRMRLPLKTVASRRLPDAWPVTAPPWSPLRSEIVPETPPPGKPYGLGRQEFKILVNEFWMPSGKSLGAGLRGGDVIGRIDYFAMGFAGDAGGVSGGVLSAAYRGFPARLTATVFMNTYEPSEQHDAGHIEGIESYDRDSTGIVIGSDWSGTGRIFMFSAGVHGMYERVEPETRGSFRRIIAAVQGASGMKLSWRRLGMFMGAKGRYFVGDTDGNRWEQSILSAEISLIPAQTRINCIFTGGHTTGDPDRIDLFSAGGWNTTVEPDIHRHDRVPVPYLPSQVLSGEKFTLLRVEFLPFKKFPLQLFCERLRFETGGEKTPAFRTAGVEIRGTIPFMPIVKLPATRVCLGVSCSFDEPAEDEWRGYIGIRMYP